MKRPVSCEQVVHSVAMGGAMGIRIFNSKVGVCTDIDIDFNSMFSM